MGMCTAAVLLLLLMMMVVLLLVCRSRIVMLLVVVLLLRPTTAGVGGRQPTPILCPGVVVRGAGLQAGPNAWVVA